MRPQWIDARCSRLPGIPGAVSLRLGSTEWKERLDSEVSARLAELDRFGVQTQVLYAPPTLGVDDSLATPDGLGIVNDVLEVVASSASGRLRCIAHIEFDDSTRGMRALETAMSHGFCGVAVGTRHGDHRLDQPFFRPFLTCAERHGIPVLVRSIGLQGSGPLIDERQQNNVGVHGDLAICIARMIFAGVFEELPRLGIYLLEGGGILPGLVARLDHGYEVRKECRALLPKPPSSYLRNVYVDGASMDEATLKCTISLLGRSQILFASDVADCVAERRRIDQVLAHTGDARSQVTSVCDENARRLYGLGDSNAH
jgi:aminocarboxymuconate-semialdehyde decarboxylase